MTDIIYALLAIAMVLSLVSLLVPLAERLRLPHTVLLAIAGMGLGFLCTWITSAGYEFGVVGDIFLGLIKLEHGTDVFLPLFLPPLLFTAGLTIDVRRLFDEIFAVLLMAIVAVLVCIAGVAGAVHLATGIDVMVCLLLGAIVSTTDPAAVIGIFRDVGAPKRLSILAEGESLLNDAVAIAAFGFCIGFLVRQSDPDIAQGVASGMVNPFITFVREFVGGIVFGFLMARVAMVILPRLGDSDAAIASVTVSLAYASYVLADHYLHVSGVVAVVMAALTVAAYGPTHLHPRRWASLRQLWTQLDFWSNCLIFILASMLAANVVPQITWLYVGGLLAVAAGAFVARILVVFGMLPLLELSRLVQPVNTRYKVILVWGGLRGAVTIVLAMVAAGDVRLSSTIREFAAVLATLFVLFTLFVNATTLGLVMRVLGLDKLTRLELALRDRVLALSRINVAHQMQQIIREHNVRVEGIDVDPISAGDAEVEAPPAELALSLDERLTVGLVTLCTQERELYLEQFEQQTLSRRMVARLMARADRLVDAVRDRGTEGYLQTIRDFALPDRGFRFGLWLQRRFGIERVLTERLADRFEILMVQQDVLPQLEAFNLHSISDLLGSDAEARLSEVLRDRRELVAHSLHALTLQYAGYAEAIRDRQLERAAIRLEAAEYARRLRRIDHWPGGLYRPAPAAQQAPRSDRRPAAAPSRTRAGGDDRARSAVRHARQGSGDPGRQPAAAGGGAAGGEDRCRRRATGRHVLHRGRGRDGGEGGQPDRAEGRRLLRRAGAARQPPAQRRCDLGRLLSSADASSPGFRPDARQQARGSGRDRGGRRAPDCADAVADGRVTGCLMPRKMHLAQFLVHGPTYHSLAMWRHPKTAAAGYDWSRPALYQHIARVCERGLFDMVFFADLNYISDTYRRSLEPALRYAAQAPEHDPIPLLSYMAAATSHIGVASTFSVSQHHPFYAARLWATLDHLTEGRAGWNVVTSINHNQDANFGVDRPPADMRYDRAHEFIEVCRKLWSSWDEDAVVMDRDGAMFADAGKVRRIEHAGAFFRSRGPLNVVRSPQDGPAILQAGTSPKGVDFAAKYADAIFAIQPRPEDAKRYFDGIKGRMAEFGRAPEECRILFGAQPIIGASEAEAREKQDEHNRPGAARGRHDDPVGPRRLRPLEDRPGRTNGRSYRAGTAAAEDPLPQALGRVDDPARGRPAPRPERRPPAVRRHGQVRCRPDGGLPGHGRGRRLHAFADLLPRRDRGVRRPRRSRAPAPRPDAHAVQGPHHARSAAAGRLICRRRQASAGCRSIRHCISRRSAYSGR